MNPLLVAYIMLAAALLWILIAWLFPHIGGIIKSILNDVKNIIKENDEDEDE